MANNPYVNKVVFGSATLVDLTGTTATADKIMQGYGAFGADGAWMDGTATGGDQHGTIWQDGQGYVHLDDESGIALQSKSVTPSESQQIVEAGEGYYALDKVTVGAISSSYVGSGITRRSSSDLSASGATVTAPAGYYETSASKSVASGTAGTPTATKSAVSNHAVTVTPSVTNTTGYITGSTKTGTAVSVSASELVSGTYNVTSSGTKDVTNYASASVPAGTEGTPTATKGSVSNHSVSVTPSVTNTGGYISGTTKTGTAVTVSASELVSGSETKTENGTYNVTNLAELVVNVASSSTQHTATISRTDGNTIPRAQVNGTGTNYGANGATFTWNDGDTIRFYFGGSDYVGTVHVNGVPVYTSTAGGYYTYTPPKCDIGLEFYRNTNNESFWVHITYSHIDIDESGAYDTSDYCGVTVDAHEDLFNLITRPNSDFKIDLPASIDHIGDYAFYNARITRLVLRKSDSIVTLGGVNAFYFISSRIVYVYAPSALLSAYQNDSVWGSVTGLSFVALEGSIYE